MHEIADAKERAQVLRQANKVWAQSAGVAVAATALVVVLRQLI